MQTTRNLLKAEQEDKGTYTLKMKNLPKVIKVSELSKQIFKDGHEANYLEGVLRGQGYAVIAWNSMKNDTLVVDLVPAFNRGDNKLRTNRYGKPYFIFTQEHYDHPELIPKDIDWSNIAVESPENLGQNSGAIHAFSVRILQLSGRMPKNIGPEFMFGLGIFKGGAPKPSIQTPLFSEFRNHSANLNSKSVQYHRELLLANYYSPPNEVLQIHSNHNFFVKRVLPHDISQAIYQCLLKELLPYQSIVVLDDQSKQDVPSSCIKAQIIDKSIKLSWIEEDGISVVSIKEDASILEKLPKPGITSDDVSLIKSLTQKYPFHFIPDCDIRRDNKSEVESWWEKHHNNPLEKNRQLMQTLLTGICVTSEGTSDNDLNKLVAEIIFYMKKNNNLIESTINVKNPLFSITDDLKKELGADTLLAYAIARNVGESVINQIIQASSDIQSYQEGLVIACGLNKSSIVTTLIEAKADLNASTLRLPTPLSIAALRGRQKIVKILLEAKANPNQINANTAKAIPLFMAVFNDHQDIVKLLLSAKADFTYQPHAAHLAAQHDNTNVLRMLIEQNADFNKTNEDGLNPLHLAIYFKSINTIELLLKNKHLFDINATSDDSQGATAAIIAAQEKDVVILKMLYEAKADLEKPRLNDGATPLHRAVLNGRGHEESAKFLINHYKNIFVKSNSGMSAFQYACEVSDWAIAKLFLNKVDDKDIPESDKKLMKKYYKELDLPEPKSILRPGLFQPTRVHEEFKAENETFCGFKPGFLST